MNYLRKLLGLCQCEPKPESRYKQGDEYIILNYNELMPQGTAYSINPVIQSSKGVDQDGRVWCGEPVCFTWSEDDAVLICELLNKHNNPSKTPLEASEIPQGILG